MRLAIGLSTLLLLCTPAMIVALPDKSGTDPAARSPHDEPGEPCGQCPDPALNSWGLAFREGDLWQMDRGYMAINHLDDDCGIIESIALSGVSDGVGLGYDSLRDLWIIDDPNGAMMYVFDINGTLVNSWPTAPAGCTAPVGCAYDSTRDLYCTCCWLTNTLYAFDPTSGSPAGLIPVPAGSRISGLGYDAHSDVFFYHGRDQAYSYWISAESGALLAMAPIPTGGGNNGKGAACEPYGDHQCWLTHSEEPTIFCLQGMGVTTTESVTWGQLKDRFK